MEVASSLFIAAPQDVVWNITLDVASWPDWTPTVRSVRPLSEGPISPGHRFSLKQPMQEERVWTVTRLEPQDCFCWESREGGLPIRASHNLVARHGGTENTLVAEIDGAPSGLSGILFKWIIFAALWVENRSLKKRAERGQA